MKPFNLSPSTNLNFFLLAEFPIKIYSRIILPTIIFICSSFKE